jgi:hypothetical protein
MGGFKDDLWSDCSGVNCAETCPSVATGPDAYCPNNKINI